MNHVHIVDDVPEELVEHPGLTLVVALDGFLDAGHAASLATRHLASTNSGPVVATFDADVFHDYRARRPAVTFSRDHYVDYDTPRLLVRLMHDELGAPYLMLTGPEPDSRWEAFARGVQEVVKRFRVSVVVTLDSVPMTTPHTRPLPVTQFANNPQLMLQPNLWEADLRVPASAHAMLAVRLGEWGHDLTGFVVHVPHYLAEFDHSAAAKVLVERLQAVTGMVWDNAALEAAAQEQERRIAEHLEANPDVASLVAGLEQQYDTFKAAERAGNNLLAEGTDLPTGDEIGAEFERFLANLDDPDNRPEGS